MIIISGQEWNHMVDRAVTEGVTEEEFVPGEEKRDHCASSRIDHEEGWKPISSVKILQKAIGETEGIHFSL